MTAGKGNLSTKDITKFNAQYPKLSVKTTTDFHDRFLIIDKVEVYHIGASIKDAGKKSFGITKIEDEDLVNSLVNKVRQSMANLYNKNFSKKKYNCSDNFNDMIRLVLR